MSKSYVCVLSGVVFIMFALLCCANTHPVRTRSRRSVPRQNQDEEERLAMLKLIQQGIVPISTKVEALYAIIVSK